MQALKLFITAGIHAGQSQTLFDGLEIGRNFGHLKINDPKLSKRHARVTFDSGVWKINDLGSKNLIVADGSRVEQLVLKPGVRFRLGKHEFEVQELLSDQDTGFKTSVPLEGYDATRTNIDGTVGANKRSWKDLIREAADKLKDKINQDEVPTIPFNPMIKLTFLRGLHVETVWKLGYGPRQVGSHSIDLTIADDECPPIAFELIPVDGGVQFETSHPEIVLLNEHPKLADKLQSGDTIRIGPHLIAVEYIEK